MSITPIEPLAIPHIGPVDPDWFEDDTPEPDFDKECGLSCSPLVALEMEL